MGWVVVHLDDHHLKLVRETEANPLPVYRFIMNWDRCHLWSLSVRPEEAAAVLDDSVRPLAHCPTGARFAAAFKAQALNRLGRHADAFEFSRQQPDCEFEPRRAAVPSRPAR